MVIQKFGGTSVGSAERIKNVSKLVNNGDTKVVVLSAMSGTTNSLVEISDYFYKKNKDGAIETINDLERKYKVVIEELLSTDEYKTKANELIGTHFGVLRSKANVDFALADEKEVLAQGELLSTNLFTFYNLENGIDAVLLPALDYMKIDENGEPEMPAIIKGLSAMLEKHSTTKLFVTQGFICRNPEGEIDNLKRGGSDYSASLIGAAIKSDVIEIWTDIDGVHNNDPRFVDKTYPIAKLSFDEAAELAYFGAKILHPLSVLPAKMAGIPVKLKNTLDPAAEGTTISNELVGEGIKAIAAKDGLVAIKIKSTRMLLAYGFLRKVFEIFEKFKTSIDLITTSEVAISLTIDNVNYLSEIQAELKTFGAVSVDKDQTIICVVGNMIAEEKGHAVEVLKALGDISVRMISYGGSRHNISLLIDTENKQKALQRLNDNLFIIK